MPGDQARDDEDARADDPADEQGGAVEQGQLAGQLGRGRGGRGIRHTVSKSISAVLSPNVSAFTPNRSIRPSIRLASGVAFG